jgi:hypothetical protein
MSLKDYLMQNQASMKEWLTTRDRIIAQKIFEAYCIPVDDLLKCFEEQESTEKPPKQRPPPIKVPVEDKKEYTESYLQNSNIKDLKKICKSRKLKKYSKLGKKDLVALILGKKQVCSPKEDKPKVILRKHPYFKDYFVHTGFLIKTKKEGVVGKVEKREGETPLIVPLVEADLVKCKALRLPVKDST